MSKPIFCAAHSRACSTAFERVFMTRTEDLTCVHEPCSEAWYYGPERLSSRYEDDGAIKDSYSSYTFKAAFEDLNIQRAKGKRVFIKEIANHLIPPHRKPAQIAPAFLSKHCSPSPVMNGERIVNGLPKSSQVPFPYGTETEPGNPTVVPVDVLKQYHFTFLIRDPHHSIPSYYRCTVPPRSELTNFHGFYPSEAGYDELRRFFDYLMAIGQVGPKRAGFNSASAQTAINGHATKHMNGVNGRLNGSKSLSNGSQVKGFDSCSIEIDSKTEICLIDADDLLDNPEGIIREYCRSVGLRYDPCMLNWDEDSHRKAKVAFEKWRGFHDDAADSTGLKPRPEHKKKLRTEDQWDEEWKNKFGEKAAKIIRETVDANMEHYLYLKQFAMRV